MQPSVAVQRALVELVEKQALSPALVERAMRKSVSLAQANPDRALRYTRFLARASNWAKNPALRRLRDRHAMTAVMRLPQVKQLQQQQLPTLFSGPRELPQSVQKAFLQQPLAQSAGLVAQEVPRRNTNMRTAFGLLRESADIGSAIHTARMPGAYNAGANQVFGRRMGAPTVMFHELGHALTNRAGAPVQPGFADEVMAWRRGSQMYRTWLHGLPAEQRVGLPTAKQFLAARKTPLDSYREARIPDLSVKLRGKLPEILPGARI